MEEWSPEDAMKAYLHTLHLVQKYCNKDDEPRVRVVEPKSIELISALAAGKGAKSIVEFTTQGITPLTIALGVAAKQSGGQLICIIASSSSSSHDDDHEYNICNSMKTNVLGDHQDVGLGDVVKVVHADADADADAAGKRVCDQLIMQLDNIDFAVIDSKFDEDYLKLMFKKLIITPTASPAVVLHNLQHKKAGGSLSSFAQLVKRRRLESVTLPIGQGIELTKILGYSSSTTVRRRRRFLVTFHN